MPTINFYHPDVDRGLSVTTGPDDVQWSYGLNTVTYPTYGGEVVQILSAYADNLTVGGTVQTYKKLDEIYSWFLEVMHVMTQGRAVVNDESYSQEPVIMSYAERGWYWHIFPLSLPGYRRGREVVAPEWRLEASVYEADTAVNDLSLKAAKDGIEKVTLGIGYDPDNPFSNPFADDKNFKAKDLHEYYDEAVDNFSKLIPAYMDGNFESVIGEVGSKPAFGSNKVNAGEQTKRKEK